MRVAQIPTHCFHPPSSSSPRHVLAVRFAVSSQTEGSLMKPRAAPQSRPQGLQRRQKALVGPAPCSYQNAYVFQHAQETGCRIPQKSQEFVQPPKLRALENPDLQEKGLENCSQSSTRKRQHRHLQLCNGTRGIFSLVPEEIRNTKAVPVRLHPAPISSDFYTLQPISIKSDRRRHLSPRCKFGEHRKLIR